MRPLHCAVALPLTEARRERRIFFGGVHVHTRLREISKATCVIEIEMGQNDMTHILRVEAELADMRMHCRHRTHARVHTHQGGEESPKSALRVAHIGVANPSVDNDEPMALRLDQQAVRRHRAALEETPFTADGRATEGTQGGTVEVMDAHPADDMRARAKSLPLYARRLE